MFSCWTSNFKHKISNNKQYSSSLYNKNDILYTNYQNLVQNNFTTFVTKHTLVNYKGLNMVNTIISECFSKHLY